MGTKMLTWCNGVMVATRWTHCGAKISENRSLMRDVTIIYHSGEHLVHWTPVPAIPSSSFG
jgi:hypothetical protein